MERRLVIAKSGNKRIFSHVPAGGFSLAYLDELFKLAQERYPYLKRNDVSVCDTALGTGLSIEFFVKEESEEK